MNNNYQLTFYKKLSLIKTHNIDISMISADAYCAAFCLKKTRIFAVSMKNIKY